MSTALRRVLVTVAVLVVLFVVADRGRTARARLLTRPTWAVIDPASPMRAGFTP